MIMHTAIYG